MKGDFDNTDGPMPHTAAWRIDHSRPLPAPIWPSEPFRTHPDGWSPLEGTCAWPTAVAGARQNGKLDLAGEILPDPRLANWHPAAPRV